MITRQEAIDITKTKEQVSKMLAEIESFIREDAQNGHFYSSIAFDDTESIEARIEVFATLAENGFDVEWTDDGILVYWNE